MTTALSLPAVGHPYLGQAPRTAYKRVDAGDISGFGVFPLFTIPIGGVILDLMVNITEAFTASVTGTLGDGSDADRFMDSTTLAPTATGTKGMKQDAQPGSGGGYHYAASDAIDLTIAGATPVAGTAEFYLSYLVRSYMTQ